MMMSPGLSPGARYWRTYWVKIARFIGASTTKGATIPSLASPARNVVIFQCPAGA